MAKVQADKRGMYSWWWDSHISPKNSKWLQENLTDMDVKVKQMIKFIEEDADSFARRAEMYYKKRPELMKLVEEFYRAYRALAERYDHATGVIRQAHRTMAEAFPNQVPQIFLDDLPAGGGSGDAEPCFDVDDLQKDGFGVTTDSGKRNGHMNESHAVAGRKGLKHLEDMFGSREGRVRKGLNFHDVDKSVRNGGSHEFKARGQSESERVSKAELEISTLKNALAKVEAEKETGLVQYQKSLERLSNLESEVSHAKEDSRVHNDRASSAEAEVKMLKEALAKFEVEREASILQYQQCLDKISNLENVITQAQKDAEELTDHVSRAAAETQSLRQDMSKLEEEKEAALAQDKQYSEKISDLENRLLHAEEDARRSKECADIAEKEVEALKMELATITEEKEAASRRYQQCLETISILEQTLACAQEEVKKLHSKVDDGVVKLRDAEEKCLLLESTNQTMHSELELLAHKTTSQSEELTENQKELGRLWACIQEERMRFVEAETAFQTLQHLHAQSQEELRSMATELQNRVQILENLEARNHNLLNEIEQVTAENKGLCEVKVSSAMTIENLQNEISSLRDTIRELEAEVELRVDERNALQQEIYCLKEEINDLNKKHQTFVEQVQSVGYSTECFASSVKDLQDDNIKLREACEREKSEKAALVEKLEIMEKLIEKNVLLENSLSDLNVELDRARQKAKKLEESFTALLEEKSSLESEKLALASQLQILTDNVGKLMEKNTFLENSLLDANAELEDLRMKLNNIEGSCLLLADEKSELATVKEGLVSELEVTQNNLADLERNCLELKERYYNLERESDSALHELAQLRVSSDAEKQEHANLIKLNKFQLASMASQISLLQEDIRSREKKYDQELDKSLDAQIEIFVLQKSVEDLKERICLLLPEHQKFCESSELSKKRIAELERENLEQQVKGKSLLDKVHILRAGFYQVSKFLELDANYWWENKVEQDTVHLNCLFKKMQETQRFLFKAQDENQQLTVEQSILVTLLGQMQREVVNLTMANTALDDKLRTKCHQFLVLQGENQKYVETNDLLQLKLNESNNKLKLLNFELQNLQEQLMRLQGANGSLQEVYGKVLGEREFLKKLVSDLKEEKCHAEEENSIILTETVSQNILSLVLGNIVSDKSVEIKELGESRDKLCRLNDGLNEMVKSMEKKLGELWIIQEEKVELDKMFENLKRKCDEAEATISNQEQLMVKLRSDNDNWIKEVAHVSEANSKRKAELHSMNGELTEAKNREESLNCELEKRRIEVEMWESETASYFSEFQTSAVREALLEGKLSELIEACGNLEERNYSSVAQIEKLQEIVDSAEGKNQKLKAWITENNSALISLKDSVTSLEKQTLSDETLCPVGKRDEETLRVADAEMRQQNDGQKVAVEPANCFHLQELELRVRQIEKAVMENKRFLMLENSSANSKLEAAMRQIEELKSGSKQHQVGDEARKHIHYQKAKGVEAAGYVDDHRLQKQRHEISEEGSDSTMKDIMLDQISESSSYGISRSRRRETIKSEDQMLEMWETANRDGSIGLTVGKNRKSMDKKHRTHNPSTESLFEKEVSVDKLEISKRFSGSFQEGNERKVLERLDSDAQKLTNLQITMQDLKRKLVSTEKTKAGKNMEYDSMKEQLEESEEAIVKLFDVNCRLMKSVEYDSSEGDESRRTRRRRVSEQASRVSEKIGRLQLEVQKLQFLLLKQDDENNKSKGKTNLTERSTRILLQDYIYGSRTHQSQKKRRARFCACVKPPTTG